jgi:hypothetical protein
MTFFFAKKQTLSHDENEIEQRKKKKWWVDIYLFCVFVKDKYKILKKKIRQISKKNNKKNHKDWNEIS